MSVTNTKQLYLVCGIALSIAYTIASKEFTTATIPTTLARATKTLKQNRVRLEPCHHRHLDDARKGFTKLVSKGLGWERKPGKKQFCTFFEGQIACHNEHHIISMAIIDEATSRFIGCIQARQDTFAKGEEETHTPLSDEIPWMELVCWIHEPYWGKGHYQEALALMIEHTFACFPGCDYCMVRIAKDNARSRGAHTKFGFVPMQAPYKKSGYQWFSYDRPTGIYTHGSLHPSVA